MSSMNINQIYIANPTTVAPSSALMYLGLSPFGITNDSAITVGDLLLQIPSATWVDVTSSPKALAVNTGYVTDNGASLVTYTLPATAPLGSIIEIAGFSSGLFTVTQNTGQKINFGNTSTTVTTGSITSTNVNDYVKLLCVVANTTFTVIGGVGNFTIV